jgi:hypothetical protein
MQNDSRVFKEIPFYTVDGIKKILRPGCIVATRLGKDSLAYSVIRKVREESVVTVTRGFIFSEIPLTKIVAVYE